MNKVFGYMRKAARKIKNNTTLQALLLSFTFFILCVTMLTGTSYAWFSASISTGKVEITAGNLNVELYRYEVRDTDSNNNVDPEDGIETTSSGEYVPIDEETGIFPDEELNSWEPGETKIAYLAVKNNGTLAAKCNIYLSVRDLGLASSLQFITIPNVEHGSLDGMEWEGLISSEQAQNSDVIPMISALDDADEESANNPTYADNIGTNLCIIPNLSVPAGSTDETQADLVCFAVAFHMGEHVSDDFQNTSMDVWLSVTAGQGSSESDSFGSDFDDDAEVPEWHTYNVYNELDSIAATDADPVAKHHFAETISRVENTASVKSITFGTWNDYKLQTGKSSFDEGTSLVSNKDVKLFSDGVGNIFVLVNDDLGVIRIHNVYMQEWCKDFILLESINLGNLDTAAVTSMQSLFDGCSQLKEVVFGKYFNTARVVYMSNMFRGCNSLDKLNISAFNTWLVKGMKEMFKDCSSLESLDLSSFDVRTANSTESMFENCSSLTNIIFGHNFKTVSAISMNNMFSGCSELESLDISMFDSSSLTKASGMFKNCVKLNSIIFGKHFKADKIQTMQDMFRGCLLLSNLDISHFETTSALNNINSTFLDCKSLTELDLVGFDTSSIGTGKMIGTFQNCLSLKYIYASEKFQVSSSAASCARTFSGCSSLIGKNKVDGVEYTYSCNGTTDITAQFARFPGEDSIGYLTPASLKPANP